jgi:hypothetical protein
LGVKSDKLIISFILADLGGGIEFSSIEKDIE